jgi:NAD(P)-dependent dehydrogenase (short-subunit alcohol dehydrogenase family)
MAPLFDVRDRIVVVTGGLGRLGRRFGACLAQQGARVAILDKQVGAAAPGIDSANLFHVEADVLDRHSLVAALATIRSHWGTPYGLVNCAAIDAPPDAPASENGPFEDYPVESFEKVMKVNVTGTLLACQVFGGAMRGEGRGSIVNISSIYGMVSPDQALYEHRRADGDAFYKPISYSASKSALFNLTRYLAAYWAPHVRVNTLTFGGVFDGQHPAFLEAYSRRAPLGRMANPGEYDGSVVFLMSDAASYMTGANMVLDGGWTAL